MKAHPVQMAEPSPMEASKSLCICHRCKMGCSAGWKPHLLTLARKMRVVSVHFKPACTRDRNHISGVQQRNNIADGEDSTRSVSAASQEAMVLSACHPVGAI